MRTHALFIALAVFAAGLSLRNARTLATLREERQTLVRQMEENGVSTDPAHPQRPVRITKRPREDRSAEARRVAEDFIAYGIEMDSLGEPIWNSDAATRHRMIEQMDEMMSLDGAQLRILIETIRDATGIDEELRQTLILFSLERLIGKRPQDGLAFFTPAMMKSIDSNEVHDVEKLVSAAMSGWANANAKAAESWYRDSGKNLPDSLKESAQEGLVSGIAKTDLRRALALAGEFRQQLWRIAPDLIGRDGQTESERLASLAVLREWIPTFNDEFEVEGSESRERAFCDSLSKLVFQTHDEIPADFQTIKDRIREAKLSDEEKALFGRPDFLDLRSYIQPAEVGNWFEWLNGNFPAEAARNQISSIFAFWVENDYKAASEWLTSAHEGPTKTASIYAYVYVMNPIESASVIQYLETLPPGEAREESFQYIYDQWPYEDTAGKAAFAKKHGIE